MGHNVRYAEYPENVDRNKVQADWDNYVRHEDWGEGASGLPGKIRWLDCSPFDSRESAESYIRSVDNGWYDQLAVRYKDVEIVKSKRYQDLEKRLQDLKNEYEKRNSVCYATTVKSEYVGCKSCGSRLASRYIQHTNKCPLCKNDLRSLTTLTNLGRLCGRIQDTLHLLKEEDRKLAKKQEKSADVKWLVKIEYHT